MTPKRHIKILGLALVAVLAFSAIAAMTAEANAPRWTVGEVTLGAGKEEKFNIVSTGTVTMSIPTLGIEFISTNSSDCTISVSSAIVGSAPGAPGTGSGEFTCKNVEVNSPFCTVTSENELVDGLVASEKIKGTLVWLQEKSSEDAKAGILSEPPGGTFTNLLVTGMKCPISGTYNVTGCTLTEASPTTKDLLEGKVVVTGKTQTYWTYQTPTRSSDLCKGMYFGNQPAFITGTFDASLPSGKTGGIEPG